MCTVIRSRGEISIVSVFQFPAKVQKMSFGRSQATCHIPLSHNTPTRRPTCCHSRFCSKSKHLTLNSERLTWSRSGEGEMGGLGKPGTRNLEANFRYLQHFALSDLLITFAQFRVWRSWLAHLHGVQGVVCSSQITPT